MPTLGVPDNATPQRVSFPMSIEPPSATPPSRPAPGASGALSYRQAGVDYAVIDPLKVAAQRAALATGAHLATHGFGEVAASRGESAYVVDVGPFYLASIVECLGSKALVADEMQRLTGRSYYAEIAQDTIAMAINDLITVGATPLVVQAYWAAGGSSWFADTVRAEALVAGWKAACDRCRVAWGGGETPALAGIVADGRIDLAASCTGLVRPKTRLSLGDALAPGDAIVLLESSGIHANGVSLARELAKRLPERVPHVITIGTPFSGGPDDTHVGWLFRLLNGRRAQEHDALRERLAEPPPVPTVSLYSRRDGVVAWEACVHARSWPLARDIEVQASHIGMGWAPEVLTRVTSVLACRRRDTAQKEAA